MDPGDLRIVRAGVLTTAGSISSLAIRAATLTTTMVTAKKAIASRVPSTAP